MAPIFFRQGSNNIKIGTVCQRQGGANPETADLYMRQGAANALVYRKAASGLYCHNCTVTASEFDSITLSPIDPYSYYYAWFRGSWQPGSNNLCLENPNGAEWSQASILYGGNLTPTTEILTALPSYSAAELAIISDHRDNSGGENHAVAYSNGTKLADVYYYPTYQFWISPTGYGGVYMSVLNGGWGMSDLFVDGHSNCFTGPILVWVNPSSMGGTPICDSVKLTIDSGVFVWS